LYSPPNIKAVKVRRMRWVGHVAFMGQMTNAEFWLSNLKGRSHWDT